MARLCAAVRSFLCRRKNDAAADSQIALRIHRSVWLYFGKNRMQLLSYLQLCGRQSHLKMITSTIVKVIATVRENDLPTCSKLFPMPLVIMPNSYIHTATYYIKHCQFVSNAGAYHLLRNFTTYKNLPTSRHLQKFTLDLRTIK